VRPKTLALLAAVVALLAAFIVFFERDLPSSDERKERAKKLFRVAADDVVSLVVEWNGATVELERDPAPAGAGESAAFPPPREWRLLAPLAGRADRALADRLATTLAGLESERRLEGVERAAVGLAPARGRLRWKTPAAEGSLELGGDVPASTSLVAAVDGGELVVIPRAVIAELDRAPGDWRAKEVLPAGRDEIERVRLVPAGGAEEVVLSRRGEGFAVERPYADTADPDAVEPLLTDLTSLRVESFLDAPLAAAAEQGLAATAGRLELALKGRAEPYVVEIGAVVADSERRYVRAAGQAFEARTRLAEALTRDAALWRSRRWTTFESWKFERLKIDDAAGTLELARSGADWLRDGVKIPYTEVGDLLYVFASARADRVEAAAARPDEKPELTAIVSDAGGAEETLTLYAARADGVPARVSGREAILLLPAKTAEELNAKLAAVRAARPEEEKSPPAASDEAPPAGADADDESGSN